MSSDLRSSRSAPCDVQSRNPTFEVIMKNQHPQLTGSEILWASLAGEGVSTVFGYPGGAILPIYDALRKFPSIHHVLVRHEQGASHMADGYARASGRPGVCMAT